MKIISYFSMPVALVVVLLLPVVFGSACSGQKVLESPIWVTNAEKSEAGDILMLSQKMAGHWAVNEALSDNPREVMEAAFENSNLFKRSRASTSRDDSGRPSMRGVRGRPGPMSGLGDPDGLSEDSRLQVLFARELDITFADEKLLYRFQNMTPHIRPDKKPNRVEPNLTPIVYPINGEPVSDDGNVNIAFAEWERQQFIIEKNGPRGRILEHWTPSPDGSQLHVRIQFAVSMLSEPVIMSRLFDARR
ncbi:MAG: hypothetical protein JXA04_02145 [Gammaproteobacteria bacterium]|nr:hypothetical protein [Gammaproteobacteria bacterium]